MSKRRAIENNSGSNSPPGVKKKNFLDTSANGSWKIVGDDELYIFTTISSKNSQKIASFDIDGTIIKTKSGRVFPTDENDWRILYPEISSKLRSLVKNDYKLVFFTNQRGIRKGKVKLPAFKLKIQRIFGALKVPVQVFVSTGSLKYRKPYVGMWEWLKNHENGDLQVDVSQSFYVGDAAGRQEREKDFSCSDRLFALNLGVKFETPEEFFLLPKRNAQSFKMPDFDPRLIIAEKFLPIFDEQNVEISPQNPEMIILVGYPGSGKTTFVNNILIPHGYMSINQDTLRSRHRCVTEAKLALNLGKNVVIDNTNPSDNIRQIYVKLALAVGVNVRCFIINCTLEMAKHNNAFRLLRDPDACHEDINDVVFNVYRSKFNPPTLVEGFCQIVHVNFRPDFDADSEAGKLYSMFLTG